MLKYFSFSIFLTTLSIVSVEPGFYDDDITNGNIFDAFNSQMFPSRFGSMQPKRPGKPVSKSPIINDDIDEHINTMDMALSKLKESLGKGKGRANMEEAHECCSFSGECHPINEGETCSDGVIRSVKKLTMQLGPQDFANSDETNSPKSTGNDLKSLSGQNGLNPLSKQNSLNSPFTPDTNNLKSPTPTLSKKLSQKPSKQFTKPTEEKDEESSPESNKMSKISSDPMDNFQNIFNGFGGPGLNGISPKNNPKNPSGLKRIGNSNSFYVMPPEKPVEEHSYEAPIGLTEEEAHKIREDVLEWTNFYRRKHNIDTVSLDDNMNNHAQEWANTIAPERVLRHRSAVDNDIYGENIFYKSGVEPDEDIGKQCVDAWYNELRYVDVNDGEERLRNNPRGVIGHMTQLLWKKSKLMGVGVSKNKSGSIFIVANYNPRGNVYGFFEENLPKFTKKDIEAAKKAQEKADRELKTPKIKVMRFDSGSMSPLSEQDSSFGSFPLKNSPFGSLPLKNSQLEDSPFGNLLLSNNPFGNSPFGRNSMLGNLGRF